MYTCYYWRRKTQNKKKKIIDVFWSANFVFLWYAIKNKYVNFFLFSLNEKPMTHSQLKVTWIQKANKIIDNQDKGKLPQG